MVEFRVRIMKLNVPLLTVLCLVVLQSLAAATAKPNFILILTDDMGYGDVGSSRGEVEAGVGARLVWSLMTAGVFWVHEAAKASPTSRIARPNLAHGFCMPWRMARQSAGGCHREMVSDHRPACDGLKGRG